MRYFFLKIKLIFVLIKDKIFYLITKKEKYNNKDRYIY